MNVLERGICTCVLTLFCFLFSYSARYVSGTVYDAVAKSTIENVYVCDRVSETYTVTNEHGHFSMLVGDSVQRLECSHIGYGKETVDLSVLQSDTVVLVQMIKSSCKLNGIDIVSAPLTFMTTKSYSHATIDETVIEEKISSSLIDVLEQVPGITKQGEYHSPIALRGLGGKRILVTKDGKRRMGNFSSGFMGQGVNIYNLEKVEVIKGPASVVYGPGAISGIINMKSKYPFLEPGLNGRLLTSYGSNNNERNILSGVNWASLDHALSFSCRYRTADEYVAGKGATMRNTSYSDKDMRLSYSWEGKQPLMLTAETEMHLGGPWGRPVGFSGTDYIRVVNQHDDTWHSSLSARWKPERRIKKIEGSVYCDFERRKQLKDSYDVGTSLLSYRENIRYRNYYAGWQGLSVIALPKRFLLTAGTDGVYYRIESPTVETDYFLDTRINNRVTKNAGVVLAGVFAETEYASKTEAVRFRGGLRADYSAINEGDVHDTLRDAGRTTRLYAWSGTSGIVYKLTNDVNLSFQFARSCRMPDSKEMFIVTSGADGMIYGNPDLVPEYGVNFDAGIRGHVSILAFDLSFFSNFLNDFISLEYWANSGKKGINYTYMNIDRARIYGSELALRSQWDNVGNADNSIQYDGTFVYTIGDKLTEHPSWFSEGVPLRNIPPFNTFHDLLFRRMVSSAVSFYVGGDIRYYATQYRIAPPQDGGYVSPAYCLFGASAGLIYKRRTVKWNLKFKGDNLADNKYYPFETLVYGMGRNFKLMLIADF